MGLICIMEQVRQGALATNEKEKRIKMTMSKTAVVRLTIIRKPKWIEIEIEVKLVKTHGIFKWTLCGTDLNDDRNL